MVSICLFSITNMAGEGQGRAAGQGRTTGPGQGQARADTRPLFLVTDRAGVGQGRATRANTRPLDLLAIYRILGENRGTIFFSNYFHYRTYFKNYNIFEKENRNKINK
jgi:hypothetical protein